MVVTCAHSQTLEMINLTGQSIVEAQVVLLQDLHRMSQDMVNIQVI